MAHAEKCPICEGKGALEPSPVSKMQEQFPPRPTCHGCGGKGWVEVSDETKQEDQYVRYITSGLP